VRARIAADGSIADGEVVIEADGGVVTIRGTAESLGDADKIREIVRQAPGVKEVNSEMRVRARW
jgi:osmotically-inducible protein OsmY